MSTLFFFPFFFRESQKRRRRYTLLKRRNLSNTSTGSGKTQNMANGRVIPVQANNATDSEADKGSKFKRRRKRSSRKNFSLPSPQSSDETGQGW